MKKDKPLLEPQYPFLLQALALSCLAASSIACAGESYVGKERVLDDDTGVQSGDGDDDDDDGDDDFVPDCSDFKPSPLQPNDTNSSNDWGDLKSSLWKGYVEDNGSDNAGLDVTLTIGDNGDATIRFGEAPPIAPATAADADLGFLCSNADSSSSACQIDQSVENWEYQVNQAERTSQRLQFHIELTSPWASWCELQTPYLHSHDRCSYQGYPDYMSRRVTEKEGCQLIDYSGVETTIDCGWIELLAAHTLCQCDDTRCAGIPTLGYTQDFDLALDADGKVLSDSQGLHLFLVE